MKLRSLYIFVSSMAILNGCTPTVDENVIDFVKETKERKAKYMSGIPQIPEVVYYQYTAYEFRDPFTPYSRPNAEIDITAYQGGPDLNRTREPLEAFPLDSLQMVGTIERDNIFFALLKNAAGNIFRVCVGNYVGQNSGKIESINAHEIRVKEWLSNGKSGWHEHTLTIPLQNKKNATKEVS